MFTQVQVDSIPAEIAALPSTAPTMEWYPFTTLLDMVANGTLDVGMCGVYALPDRSKRFDYAPACAHFPPPCAPLSCCGAWCAAHLTRACALGAGITHPGCALSFLQPGPSSRKMWTSG